MIYKIKRILLLSLTFLCLSFAFGATPALAALDCSPENAPKLSTKEAIQCGSCNASGTNCAETSPEKSSDSLNHLIKNFINIFSIIVGIAAVIMLIVAGFRYITAGGDSNRIAAAKNTLVYALVGLVIAVLAQTIVRFVLNKATNQPKTTSLELSLVQTEVERLS